MQDESHSTTMSPREAPLPAVMPLRLYSGVLEGEPVRLLAQSLTLGESRDGRDGVSAPVDGAATALARRLFRSLAEEIELSSRPLAGTPWQTYLLRRILDDENPFSLKAQRQPFSGLSPALVAAAREDLRDLQRLHRLDLQALLGTCGEGLDLDSMAPLEPVAPEDLSTASLLKRLGGSEDWGEEVEALAGYYHAHGAGVFRRYRAFRWVPGPEAGRLEGIAELDPIRLENLIGYDSERELLLRNTEFFLAGYPANNVLVYGERGTGKSSTIKALLHEYGDRGLRLIEVPKSHLADFTQILRLLRGRRERFILFVDDLSFEEDETSYKELKAVLEGGLEARPDNVLLYATSNRKHLVTERFSDRHVALSEDEVHFSDTVQEKLSLSDRFGIALVFYGPDQKRFLRIVRGLAEQRGLAISQGELDARAILWIQQHNERSGRTARQFIDFLTAELALQARG